MGVLQITVNEVIGIFIALAIGAFMLFKLFDIIQTGAPAWVNNTINNITQSFTGTVIPVTVLAIIIIMIMIGWNVWQSSSRANGGAMY